MTSFRPNIDDDAYYHRGVTAARISSERICGCSQAAKWPPSSTLSKRMSLGYAFSAQLRGARIELVGKDGHADRDLDALDVEERQMAPAGRRSSRPLTGVLVSG